MAESKSKTMKSKLLILGGKPIGSVELVEKAKQMGLYTIVADYLPKNESPAKAIADEAWNISTAEVDELVKKCREANVTAVTTGVHEFNINRMLELTATLRLPCYCKPETWIYCDDKVQFKQLCANHQIPIAHKYEIDKIADAVYPIITKPVDGSGSRGFHICQEASEFDAAYKDAELCSPTGRVLIEDYIPYDAVIIHYTMISGKCYYSGMSDKVSVRFSNTGSSVMGIQTFPSKGEQVYLDTLDEKVRSMFETAGFTEGPIWIESFFDGKDKFVFNEMGYRFGGSLTYYPVRYFYGIDQLNLYIKTSFGEKVEPIFKRTENKRKYCILPIHIHAGQIDSIEGMSELRAIPNFYAFAPVHYVGDKIEEWGSARQVFGYLHVLYNNTDDLKETIHKILHLLSAKDNEGKNMLYTLFDIDSLQ